MPVQTCGSKATSSTTSPSPYRGHTNRTPSPSTLKLSSNLAELPQHIHKQLLLDIKEGGGIYCTKFQHHGNWKPELYGNPATLQRWQAQNKHHQWKSLDLASYYKLLLKFGVLPNGSQEPEEVAESQTRQEPILAPPACQQQRPPQSPSPQQITE
jgi:hypothetical protein